MRVGKVRRMSIESKAELVGTRWSNEYGPAKVLAVHRGWAWMIRRRGNPFTISTARLLDPAGGWTRELIE